MAFNLLRPYTSKGGGRLLFVNAQKCGTGAYRGVSRSRTVTSKRYVIQAVLVFAHRAQQNLGGAHVFGRQALRFEKKLSQVCVFALAAAVNIFLLLPRQK